MLVDGEFYGDMEPLSRECFIEWFLRDLKCWMSAVVIGLSLISNSPSAMWLQLILRLSKLISLARVLYATDTSE